MKVKQVVLVTLTVCCLAVGPVHASAYDCTGGGEHVSWTSNMHFAQDSSGRAVWLDGRTTRSIEDVQNCPGWVRVEGWITGDPAGAMTDQNSGGIAELGSGCGGAVCGGPLMLISCTCHIHGEHQTLVDRRRLVALRKPVDSPRRQTANCHRSGL